MNTCGICGGDSLKFLFNAGDFNLKTTEEVFTIVRCAGCGVVQTVPRPPEETLGRFYPPAYYPMAELGTRAYDWSIRKYQMRKLDIVRRYRRSGTLLDVGCGAGYFVREAENHGFIAEGIEFSPQAADFARTHCGVKVTTGDILKTSFEHRKYDVVTLWQVLEHVAQPVETVRKIRTLLVQGGILIVSVPNFRSIQAGVFRDRWYHLEIPRHLYHFDPVSLGKILEQEGFSVLAVRHRSGEHNWAGFLASVVPLESPRRSFSGRILRKAVGRPLARIAAGFEAFIRRGGTMTIIAQSVE